MLYITCDICGRKQKYAGSGDPGGITFEEARTIGWIIPSGAEGNKVFCPFCACELNGIHAPSIKHEIPEKPEWLNDILTDLRTALSVTVEFCNILIKKEKENEKKILELDSICSKSQLLYGRFKVQEDVVHLFLKRVSENEKRLSALESQIADLRKKISEA